PPSALPAALPISYSSPSSYSWRPGAAEPGARTTSAADKAANSASDTITLTDDTDAPTGQAITLTGPTAPYYATTSVSFNLTNGSDAAGGAGLDPSSSTVTRETGTLSGDTCSSFNPDGGTYSSP